MKVDLRPLVAKILAERKTRRPENLWVCPKCSRRIVRHPEDYSKEVLANLQVSSQDLENYQLDWVLEDQKSKPICPWCYNDFLLSHLGEFIMSNCPVL